MTFLLLCKKVDKFLAVLKTAESSCPIASRYSSLKSSLLNACFKLENNGFSHHKLARIVGTKIFSSYFPNLQHENWSKYKTEFNYLFKFSI